MPSTISRRAATVAIALVMVALAGSAEAGPRNNEETWNSIRPDIFDDVAILDGAHLLTLEAPYRAHDAAVVPITVKAAPDSGIVKITLVIDENPAPLAAAIEFGPAAASPSFVTRVRVNSYSYVRAVARTRDGNHYMVKKFVKASGGCSAPASKDMDKAVAQMGKMKLRLFADQVASASTPIAGRPAQLMIRHPNYSGFQMDQVSLLYIPAHFVDLIEVTYDGQLVMKVEGGISLSEDPNIRFFYKHTGAGEMRVHATDIEQGEFVRSWPVTGS